MRASCETTRAAHPALRDQQAVERIAMVQGQIAHRDGMLNSTGSTLNSIASWVAR